PLPAGTPRFAPKRYAVALLDHLTAEEHLPGPVVGGVLLASPEIGIVPSANWAFEELGSRGLLNRYVHHVRSSHAFALNLFGPLDRQRALVLFRTCFPETVE